MTACAPRSKHTRRATSRFHPDWALSLLSPSPAHSHALLLASAQCTALSAFAQGASGGAFVGTEARRGAAARAGGLEAVLAAMRLAPHRSAVQHFGITALNAICATGNAVGVPPVMSRCGLAVRAGAPSLILEAMRRFGHVRSDQGVCLHRMQGPDGGEIECAVPGSILQSGCMALDCLVADDDESRIQALNDAGTLKARRYLQGCALCPLPAYNRTRCHRCSPRSCAPTRHAPTWRPTSTPRSRARPSGSPR